MVAFFAPIGGPLLVRKGSEVRLERHGRMQVYREMLFTIIREYPGIGDWRILSAGEIEVFYDALRSELKRASKGSK